MADGDSKRGWWVALAGGIGAAALLLSNIDTLLTKPEAILKKVGAVQDAPLPITVRLARLNDERLGQVIAGKENDPFFARFQPYTDRGGAFCLSGRPMDACPGAPAVLEQPAFSAAYYADDTLLEGPWGPAVPVFDLLAVRPGEDDMLITAIAVEYELVSPDRRPLLQVLTTPKDAGALVLALESPVTPVRVDLAFRILDPVATNGEDGSEGPAPASLRFEDLDERMRLGADSFRSARRLAADSGSLSTRLFRIDIGDAVRRRFAGTSWTTMRSPDFPASTRALDGPGFRDQARAQAVPVVGTLDAAAADGSQFRLKFVAMVPLVPPLQELGAGDVQVDRSGVWVIDGDRGRILQPLSLVLNDASPTIRSQAAIIFRRSGSYRLRFHYGSTDRPRAMMSDWITVQAFAAPPFLATYFARPRLPGFDD